MRQSGFPAGKIREYAQTARFGRTTLMPGPLNLLGRTERALFRTRTPLMKQLKLLVLFFFTATLSFAQSIPAIRAKALDNSDIILPRPGSQQFLILIVGFSQKSGKLCEAWSKKSSCDYHTDARIAYFTLPVLQSAP